MNAGKPVINLLAAKLTAIFIGTIAQLVVCSLPVFLSVVSRAHAYDHGRSGLLALAEMGGIATGSSICALRQALVNRLTSRRVMALGLSIFILANICAAPADAFAFLLLTRASAGVGTGIAMAITFAYLALGDGARFLALFSVAQIATGCIAVPFLGPIADKYGSGALFYLMASFGCLGCRLLPSHIPSSSTERKEEAAMRQSLLPTRDLEIYAVFFYFAGAGAVYAFLAIMGVAWGGTPTTVAGSLSAMLFTAMSASAAVAAVGSRFGFRLPLYSAYAAILICMIVFAVDRPIQHFTLISCAFGAAWNVLAPFQFQAVTYVNGVGRTAMLVNASTFGGMAVGPAIGGFLATSSFVRFNTVAIMSCAISLALIWIALRVHGRHQLAI
jgi:predicted MFS family arabinose efflux permease